MRPPMPMLVPLLLLLLLLLHHLLNVGGHALQQRDLGLRLFADGDEGGDAVDGVGEVPHFRRVCQALRVVVCVCHAQSHTQ